MKKSKFILRRMVNNPGPHESVTWDIMRNWPDGEEFVGEFVEHFEKLARKAVKALNKPTRSKR